MKTIPSISVAARRSPLSQAQAKEVLAELQQHHSLLTFELKLIDTKGDIDQKTSLRSLEKTDFFTKEIDGLLLKKKCRIGIHSAKDLPEIIPKGISVIALTKGADPSDVLVFRTGETLHNLPTGAIIATSSERREAIVKALRPDLTFVDIRGNINQRLSKLDSGEVDGVVMAEAALIRLNLTHLNRLFLPGGSTPYQGCLAITACSDDMEMAQLFSCLDSRPTTLHVGLKLPSHQLDKKYIHYPVIAIYPQPKEHPDIISAFASLHVYTHILFTSQTTVSLFFELLNHFSGCAKLLHKVCVIAIGTATADLLKKFGVIPRIIAQEESSEGIVVKLQSLHLANAHLFWPHSSLSRSVLIDYLKQYQIKFTDCVLYHTKPFKPLPIPDLDGIDEIMFTSPSTIDGFLEVFGAIPQEKRLSCIGPITKNYLNQVFQKRVL